ncbi:hypothetical protein D4R42_02585 [bacterium]|nr:MAG: hypothetical protein D4R42_02585 [bacterium]
MGGLLEEVGIPIPRVFDDAAGTTGLDTSGYCLKISTDGEVTKSAAGSAAYGFAYVNTKNVLYKGDTTLYTQYEIDPEISVIREGEIDARVELLANRSTNIHIGDILAVAPTTAGTIAHWEDNTAQGTANGAFTLANWMAARSEIVGVAEEALLATADPADGDHMIHIRVMILGDES